MRLYLSALEQVLTYPNIKEYMINNCNKIYYLSSFYYLKKQLKNASNILKQTNMNNFLLDSGAFTFIMGDVTVDIDAYTQEYINLIKEYDIKYFFEMDVDIKLGYEKVKRLRDKIETETGKQAIPVWHNNRGIEEFKKHCDEYNYIAFGSAEMKQSHDLMKKMTKYCNKKGVKIHLLGYSKQDIIDIDPYSCDSSSWKAERYGGLWNWDNTRKIPINTSRDINKRVIASKYKELDMHNLNVWVKYQNYLKYQGSWREA